MQMFIKLTELLYLALLHFDWRQFAIFSVAVLLMLIFGIIYKLVGNHINHLTAAVDNLNTTIKESSGTLSRDIKSLDKNNRKEHTKMLEHISRLIGRSD